MRRALPLVVLLAACGSGAGEGGSAAAAEQADAPKPGADTAAAAAAKASDDGKPAADDPSQPASVRIRGRWAMNIAEVPDTALTKDFREWKKQGKADQLRIEYTITESDFTLDSWSPRGRMQKKWHYEITKEMDNSLMLKRIGEDGEAQDIPAVLKDGKLIIGTGAGEVPLERIE